MSNALTKQANDRTNDQISNDPNQCLRVAEAASYLSLSKKALDTYRCTGAGPRFVKLGSRVAYRRKDLDAWVNARVQKSTTG